MMFKDFCLTIAFLLLGSLVIALTLVPLLCYMMLDDEKLRRQAEKWAARKPSAMKLRLAAGRRS